MAAVLGPHIVIPELPSFDGNVITPGTAFMARLAAMLRGFFATKLQTDPAWADIAVVLSDSSEPGEGEHKVNADFKHIVSSVLNCLIRSCSMLKMRATSHLDECNYHM